MLAGEPEFSRVVVVGASAAAEAICASASDFFVSGKVTHCRSLDGEALSALAEADLVVFAREVEDRAALARAFESIGANAVVTDVGAAKHWLRSAILETGVPVEFVGSHVLGGGLSVPGRRRTSDALSLRGVTVYVVLEPPSSLATVARVGRFWESLGARTVFLQDERHDELVANLAHLPRVLAAAQVEALRRSGEDANLLRFLWSPELRDATRAAVLPPLLWREMLADHGDLVAEGLRDLAGLLEEMAQMVDCGAREELLELLASASALRARLE